MDQTVLSNDEVNELKALAYTFSIERLQSLAKEKHHTLVESSELDALKNPDITQVKEKAKDFGLETISHDDLNELKNPTRERIEGIVHD